MQSVPLWEIGEWKLNGPEAGNPFTEVELHAEFRFGHRRLTVRGFYDGAGTYRVRCMPDAEGDWTFVTRSNVPELDGHTGSFTCLPPLPGAHGPVRVHDRFHFRHEDGTPFLPLGTTCYAWTHQDEALEKQTLASLGTAPFNKLRMCVFPKHYDFNRNEPPRHAFAGTPGAWDCTRFDPAFFQHLDRRIGELAAMGIEADLIVFHPYDRWGYRTLDAETEDRYLRYLVARLGARRNIWWSLANEYDLMRHKSLADWDRNFRVLAEEDPYQHLASIHNCREFYPHQRPWVTHVSAQTSEVHRVAEWRESYRKPVVIDECCYEGNIHRGWGNISAQEMTHRCWLTVTQGGYVTHGETYLDPADVLWWSKGGTLHGDSPARLAFLREVLGTAPAGLEPVRLRSGVSCAGRDGQYYLLYFGVHQPSYWLLELPADTRYSADVLDTWNMTSVPVPGSLATGGRVDLPGRPYLALRLRRQD